MDIYMDMDIYIDIWIYKYIYICGYIYMWIYIHIYGYIYMDMYGRYTFWIRNDGYYQMFPLVKHHSQIIVISELFLGNSDIVFV